MLADPISVKVAGAATNHPRVSVGKEYNEYSVADATSKVRVGHSASKTANRSFVTSIGTKVAADPISAVNQSVTRTITISVSRGKFGFSNAELKQSILDLCEFLTASTGANIDKLLGGES
ncbi:coat protein [ssRNA phage SRR5466369_2]|uniref:Coat protein n=1 Tax=ssRNA phage SRR5466369_2 TaxID=2786405 RepID=A0A8S5KZI4_9VIRU|nr:coat protein [ssRNA phage SRR5466369_2]DAD50809.1 TPA_asm: coat protein [ssRNA phage SRR5466369_2]